MNHPKNITVVKPVYCRECHSRDTFEPYPDRDIKTESGQVLFVCWKCQSCGHTTWYPLKISSPKGSKEKTI